MTLVVGLGNPLYGEDSIGLKIAEGLEKKTLPPNFEIYKTSESPFSLAQKMLNEKRVIIIDALKMSNDDSGEIVKFSVDELFGVSNIVNPHSVSLPAALEIFKAINPEQFPEEIIVLGVNLEGSTIVENISSYKKIQKLVDLTFKEIVH